MPPSYLKCFKETSLHPRHFKELGLNGRRLHVWTAATGFADRKEGKWRTFTPFEVLALSIFLTVKDSCDLAFSKHPGLISYLHDADRFAVTAMDLWERDESPFLLTDLHNNHRLLGVVSGFLSLKADTSNTMLGVLNLDPAIKLMMLAVKRGGTDDQRQALEQLTIDRRKRAEQKVENVTPPGKRRRIRQLDLSVGDGSKER